MIAFNSGYLHSSLQPEQVLGAAVARAARRPGTWERPPLEGLTPLRAWFAREAGGGLTPAHVLITSGGQAALTTVLRALTPPGSPVLVESPTYPGALSVARAAGLRPVPVPMDDDGVRLDLLEDAFTATGARVVVHISSLTKPTSPTLRVGALIAQGPVMERLRAIQVVDNFFVPRLLQEAALDLLGAPAWPRHLRTLAASLRDRRDAMLAALQRDLPHLASAVRAPAGGYYLWLRLPGGTDETALVGACLRSGVAISPGRPYFASEAMAPHIRLSYSDIAGTDEITDGIRRIAAACAETGVRDGA
ncbi:transcriptional regulator [Streptomyces canarius]